jgi:hypothetical protein
MVSIADRLAGQYRRPLRFDQVAADGRVVFLESGRAAGEGAAGARKIAKEVEVTAGLADDLWSGV